MVCSCVRMLMLRLVEVGSLLSIGLMFVVVISLICV